MDKKLVNPLNKKIVDYWRGGEPDNYFIQWYEDGSFERVYFNEKPDNLSGASMIREYREKNRIVSDVLERGKDYIGYPGE